MKRLTSPALPLGACLAAATLASEPAGPPRDDGPAVLSRSAWVEQVEAYARGERVAAIAALGAWSERELERQVAQVEQASLAAARCPGCVHPLDGLPLKAAVMLHWDRDREQSPQPASVEQERRCPGAVAKLAGRLARALARRSPSDPFPKRFVRAVVLTSQWDACFDHAERWADEALALYPREAVLLLDRGSVHEERAVLTRRPDRPVLAGSEASFVAVLRAEGFAHARRDFEQALGVDPGLPLARLRLGRVLWRLGELEPARRELEAALPATAQADLKGLAHLFLGRVHLDAGRLAEATEDYRKAVELLPDALSPAVALSHALGLAGDGESARLALRGGLELAGRRPQRDPYLDYLVSNAAGLEPLWDDLRRESLR
jgi:Flp pilus assembly protein TadD